MLSTHESVENMLKFPYTNRIKLYHYTLTLIGVHGFFSNVSLGDNDLNLIIVLNIIFGCQVLLKQFFRPKHPHIFFLICSSILVKSTQTDFYMKCLIYDINLHCKSWESSTTCNYGLII